MAIGTVSLSYAKHILPQLSRESGFLEPFVGWNLNHCCRTLHASRVRFLSSGPGQIFQFKVAVDSSVKLCIGSIVLVFPVSDHRLFVQL